MKKLNRPRLDDKLDNELGCIVIYSSALCNLACSYCYISKNKYMKEVDDLVNNCYSDHEFFNNAKKVVDKDNLTRVEYWGGEPTMGLERVTNTIDEWLDYYYKLEEFALSSNFCFKHSLANLYSFMDHLENYGRHHNRQFRIDLQISIDGPDYITDVNRGKGVTNDVIDNFSTLMTNCPDYQYVELMISTKPTLSINSLRDNFHSVEDVYKYYDFFSTELFVRYVNRATLARMSLFLGVPNTVTPYEYTKQDGIDFARILSYFYEFDKSELRNKLVGFNNRSLVPYGDAIISKRSGCQDAMWNTKYLQPVQGSYCGVMTHSVTLMPNNKYGICHRGYYDYTEGYVQSYLSDDKLKSKVTNVDPSFTVFDSPDEYFKASNRMKSLYFEPSFSRSLAMSNYIRLSAKCKIIDSKYADKDEAFNAANAILRLSPCIYLNLSTVGTMQGDEVSLVTLMLNGALDVLLQLVGGKSNE